jgi:exodeoxyribonuclease VII small subunit
MDDINALSFEDAFDELQRIVDKLEAGELTLEQSVDLFERGRKLSAHCQSVLDKAELRISQINDDGSTEALD